MGDGDIRNRDIAGELRPIANAVPFEWLRAAVKRVDELYELVRRNIQKGIALDALVVQLRNCGAGAQPGF